MRQCGGVQTSASRNEEKAEAVRSLSTNTTLTQTLDLTPYYARHLHLLT